MKPEIKDEWVKRLVSGIYPQGVSFLNSMGADRVRRFCCLGVLCEMAVEDGVVLREIHVTGSGVHFVAYQDIGGQRTSSSTGLTPAVRSWARLVVLSNPLSGNVGVGETNLMRLNDSDKKSFREIAGYIQEHL